IAGEVAAPKPPIARYTRLPGGVRPTPPGAPSKAPFDKSRWHTATGLGGGAGGKVARTPRSSHGKEFERRLPRYEPRPSMGVIDEGRSRFKYVPTPVKKGKDGRVTWGGLPSDVRGAIATDAEARDLEKRVSRLQADVREMSKLLDKLNRELERSRKRKMR
ncbi:MAG: hypothetical protein GY953_35670, partial [bacterium]|nr:hypothetical protein [bacterium]